MPPKVTDTLSVYGVAVRCKIAGWPSRQPQAAEGCKRPAGDKHLAHKSTGRQAAGGTRRLPPAEMKRAATTDGPRIFDNSVQRLHHPPPSPPASSDAEGCQEGPDDEGRGFGDYVAQSDVVDRRAVMLVTNDIIPR